MSFSFQVTASLWPQREEHENEEIKWEGEMTELTSPRSCGLSSQCSTLLRRPYEPVGDLTSSLQVSLS